MPLGNHSCSCTTTIRYVEDDDERSMMNAITPGFTRLHSNENFAKLIDQSERNTDYKFKFFRAIIVEYEVMVSAYFKNGVAWTVDLDK